MRFKIGRREFLTAGGATAGFGLVTLRQVLAKAARVRIVGLKVNHVDRPLGLEDPRPRFSWRLESQQRNIRQSAYRVRVADDVPPSSVAVRLGAFQGL